MNKIDVYEWNNDPVTKHFFKLVNEYLEQLENYTTSGAFLQSSHFERDYAHTLGCIDAIKQILNIELIEEEENEEDRHVD